MNAFLRRFVCMSALLAATAGAAAAQVEVASDPGSSVRTRSDLEALLVEYEQVIASPAYSDDIKANARLRAAQVRDRLENGDFKLGDAVALYVEGEVNLPDTVPVRSSPGGPVLVLPTFGEIPLEGVLRSEISAHLTEALSRYIRAPIVRATGLMRISVQGAVGQPGFYVVPADMLVSEALMTAGGPAPNAKLDELSIQRGTETLYEGEALQEEVRLGRTLDQLNLQAGDQMVMPMEQPGGGFFGNVAAIVGIVTSVSVLVIQLAR